MTKYTLEKRTTCQCCGSLFETGATFYLISAHTKDGFGVTISACSTCASLKNIEVK